MTIDPGYHVVQWATVTSWSAGDEEGCVFPSMEGFDERHRREKNSTSCDDHRKGRAMTTTSPGAIIPKPRHSLEENVSKAAGAMRAIHRHRTVRVYDNKVMSRKDVELLVGSAIPAHRGINCESWAFAVIHRREALARHAKEGKWLVETTPTFRHPAQNVA